MDRNGCILKSHGSPCQVITNGPRVRYHPQRLFVSG